MAQEGKSLAPQLQLGRGTQRGGVKSYNSSEQPCWVASALGNPHHFQSLLETSDLGPLAPLRRLLSLLILPGTGEVAVLEATDGAADGK